MPISEAYWGDAVLSTAYHINRMPLKALDFKTPLELLQGTSSYAKGVLLYMLRLWSTLSKLDPKTLKMYFCWIFCHTNGCKCYHLLTKKYFESMDVTFPETESYLSNQHHLFVGRTWITKNLWYFPHFKLWTKIVTNKKDLPNGRHLKKMKAQRRMWFKKRDSGEVERWNEKSLAYFCRRQTRQAVQHPLPNQE